MADLLDFTMSAAGSSYGPSRGGRWLALDYDAAELRGRLGVGRPAHVY